MNLEIHATGASFISGREENNPRDLVVKLVKEHPGTARKDLFEEFRVALEEANPEYRRAVEWYFFVNMYDYLVTSRNSTSTAKRIQQAEVRAQSEAAIRQEVERIKLEIVMLDLPMPNGKPMRSCTGQEMMSFGSRYLKIGERVGKGKFVGTVLNEEQVRELMK